MAKEYELVEIVTIAVRHKETNQILSIPDSTCINVHYLDKNLSDEDFFKLRAEDVV